MPRELPRAGRALARGPRARSPSALRDDPRGARPRPPARRRARPAARRRVRRDGARPRPAHQLHGGDACSGLLPPLVADALRRSTGAGDPRAGASQRTMKRDLLSIWPIFTRGRARGDLRARADAEGELSAGAARAPSARARRLAMIFEKPSLRTRVTFEIGIKQLGGAAVYLAPDDIRLGERETVADIARNLSRWVDLIVARTFSHDTVLRAGGQRDRAGDQRPVRSAASLPGARGLLHAARAPRAARGLSRRVRRRRQQRGATPGCDAASALRHRLPPRLPAGLRARSRDRRRGAPRPAGAHRVLHDPSRTPCAGADAVYTDVWTSMGQEAEDAASGAQPSAATR